MCRGHPRAPCQTLAPQTCMCHRQMWRSGCSWQHLGLCILQEPQGLTEGDRRGMHNRVSSGKRLSLHDKLLSCRAALPASCAIGSHWSGEVLTFNLLASLLYQLIHLLQPGHLIMMCDASCRHD